MLQRLPMHPLGLCRRAIGRYPQSVAAQVRIHCAEQYAVVGCQAAKDQSPRLQLAKHQVQRRAIERGVPWLESISNSTVGLWPNSLAIAFIVSL